MMRLLLCDGDNVRACALSPPPNPYLSFYDTCADAECTRYAADEHHAILPHGHEGAAQRQTEEYLLGMARLPGAFAPNLRETTTDTRVR